MEISVIVVNYRSEKFLADCFSSLQENFSDKSYEVIVVNNDDAPLKKIPDSLTDIRIINMPSNSGFAKACNEGAKIAKSDIIFFLNPDTKIIAADLKGLFSVLDKPTTGIVAPILLLNNNDIQPWSAGRALTIWSLIKNNINKKDLSINDNAMEFDWVSGGAFFISKKLFAVHGGFDENYFMYFEDMDLCRKVRRSGYKVLRLPSFSVLHLGGQSYSNKGLQKQHYFESQDYYFRKNFGFFTYFAVKILRGLFK